MSDLLEGIRVVECAVLFNGDTVGMLLGDMGADVIKVESPQQGDYLRDMLGQLVAHHSPAHLQVNKNKRSMTIDLRRDEGRDVFWDLQMINPTSPSDPTGKPSEKSTRPAKMEAVGQVH